MDVHVRPGAADQPLDDVGEKTRERDCKEQKPAARREHSKDALCE